MAGLLPYIPGSNAQQQISGLEKNLLLTRHLLQCSGNHPTCDRCASRGLNCIYDVDEEGVTRREHLRRQYEEQKSELDRAHAVLAILQGGSDHEAAQCLARLRIGYTVDEVYQMIGSNTFILNSRNLSPEAARVATQLGQAMPQWQQAEASGSTQRGWQVDGVPQMSSGSQGLQVPSTHSSPHSLDDGLLTSAGATSPISPVSDTLDPALWPEGLSQGMPGRRRDDGSASAR